MRDDTWMTRNFFDSVYQLGGPEETRDFYDRWSNQYDADVTKEGYATPARAARLLANHAVGMEEPILDFGCGTGISGEALRAVGFSTIDGVDPSSEMLAGAREKGIYRSLDQIEPGSQAPVGYLVIAAIGVIGCGAAPVSVVDRIMDALMPGGLFVLSYNDHALAEPEYEERLHSHMKSGKARLLEKEYGPHLTKLGLNSMVYVIERL